MSIKKQNRRRTRDRFLNSLERGLLEVKRYRQGRGHLWRVVFLDDGTAYREEVWNGCVRKTTNSPDT